MAAAGKASQPSESDPCPLAEVRHDSTISKIEVGVHIFAYFSYLYALHTQDTHTYILCVYSCMKLNIQAKERVLMVPVAP